MLAVIIIAELFVCLTALAFIIAGLAYKSDMSEHNNKMELLKEQERVKNGWKK